MPNITIRPTQITLATTDTPAMLQFYTAVFALDFEPVSMYGTTLYRSTLDDTAFVLCPNTLAEVQAEQSRHQFSYSVSELNMIVERAITAGGKLQEQTPATDRPASAVIRDPDGNSIVFIQAASAIA